MFCDLTDRVTYLNNKDNKPVLTEASKNPESGFFKVMKGFHLNVRSGLLNLLT